MGGGQSTSIKTKLCQAIDLREVLLVKKYIKDRKLTDDDRKDCFHRAIYENSFGCKILEIIEVFLNHGLIIDADDLFNINAKITPRFLDFMMSLGGIGNIDTNLIVKWYEDDKSMRFEFIKIADKNGIELPIPNPQVFSQIPGFLGYIISPDSKENRWLERILEQQKKIDDMFGGCMEELDEQNYFYALARFYNIFESPDNLRLLFSHNLIDATSDKIMKADVFCPTSFDYIQGVEIYNIPGTNYLSNDIVDLGPNFLPSRSTIQIFLDNGFDINSIVRNIWGRAETLLEVAVRRGSSRVVKFLLENGATPREDDVNHEINLAKKLEHRTIIKLLEDHGFHEKAEFEF